MEKPMGNSDAPTQTMMAIRAPLAMVPAVDDDDDEPVLVVGLACTRATSDARRTKRPVGY